MPKVQAKKGRELGNAKGIVTLIANNYPFWMPTPWSSFL